MGLARGRPADDQILLGDSLELLPGFDDGSFQLVYIDPPFNTGKTQTRRTLEAVADRRGDRTGFNGRRYRTSLLAESYRARGNETQAIKTYERLIAAEPAAVAAGV